MLFERGEYLDRLARVKRSMTERDIDLLLIASPANQFYLTGYDGWSFYTPQMVVVALDQDEPIWFGRKMDAVGAEFTVFMDYERIIPYDDSYVASTDRHPMQALVALIRAQEWSRGRIGVEMDDYYYTARWHEILKSNLSEATFVDAFLLVNWVRLRKSDREVEYMMQAGKISEVAMQAALDTAEPGVRQCDVIAELNRATTAGTAEFGGTFTCKPPNAMAGAYCAAPHLSWTEAPLKAGEILYIEQGGVRHRYHAPLSRCLYLGTPSDQMAHLSQVIAEGLNAVLDTVKPGVVLEELAAAWSKVIARHGIEKDSRIGYPVGIGYPPTWGELTCSLRQGDRTVLEPNMTFHCIPALWLDDTGLVISESFVVTPTGAKTFADFPRKLFSK
ncbi:MAG: Xaa-Pro peptidase family protein [Proteobacteria bacterium]|nr:Xaa-Pro peptidase family protein [Pseudomonadota bacterium]